MSNTIRNALLLMCIFTFPSGCVSTPPPKEPTPVEQRETSVMTARETRVIEVNKELFTAAFHGRTSEAKAFFEAQEDEEVRMKDGWTALLLACGRGHTEVVLALDGSTVSRGRCRQRRCLTTRRCARPLSGRPRY